MLEKDLPTVLNILEKIEPDGPQQNVETPPTQVTERADLLSSHVVLISEVQCLCCFLKMRWVYSSSLAWALRFAYYSGVNPNLGFAYMIHT